MDSHVCACKQRVSGPCACTVLHLVSAHTMHSVVASNSCPFCLCSAQCAAPHAAGTCAQVFSCVRMLAPAWSSMHVRSTTYIVCTHNAQQRRTQFIASELMFSPVCGHTTASKWVDPHVSACDSMARSVETVRACAQHCIHSVTHSMQCIVAPYSSPVSLCSTRWWPHMQTAHGARVFSCVHMHAPTWSPVHVRSTTYILCTHNAQQGRTQVIASELMFDSLVAPHANSTRRACFLMCAHACTNVVTRTRTQYYIHHVHTQCTAGSYPSHCQ